jgi:predicted site-specific integrase-resolvase
MKQKTFTTPEAARRIGVSFPTLHRWLRDGKIRPTVAIPVHNRTLWAWTDADIAKGRKVKSAQRPGPKPRAGAK